jgi:para-nitrobenzyl esterase
VGVGHILPAGHRVSLAAPGPTDQRLPGTERRVSISTEVVETGTGRVRGRRVDGVWAFDAVPYAAAPVGVRRFVPPEPHDGWDDVLDATAPAPRFPDAEDCLSLDVRTPAVDDGRRPVMVWIHGGGFVEGSASDPLTEGSRLAHRGDVVVVACNYRLGALGWLHLGHLDADLAGSGNNGLLDQIAALCWVRDNVAAFGGDPGNVTVFGHSAGAMSIAALLGAPACRGLFHRAILQSGAAHNVRTVDEAVELADRVVHELGSVEQLRSVAPARLREAQTTAARAVAQRGVLRPGPGLPLPFGPVVDGITLPSHPLEVLASGGGADVPLLVGTNRDEWTMFGRHNPAPTDAGTFVEWLAYLGDRAAWVAAPYLEHHGDDLGVAWDLLVTDRSFRVPAIRLVDAHRAGNRSPAFMYRFDWPSPDRELRAYHAIEIPFVFDRLDTPGLGWFIGHEAPRGLATAVQGAWAAFARTGVPAHDDLAGWSPYGDDRATVLLDATCSAVADPDAAERRAWEVVF